MWCSEPCLWLLTLSQVNDSFLFSNHSECVIYSDVMPFYDDLKNHIKSYCRFLNDTLMCYILHIAHIDKSSNWYFEVCVFCFRMNTLHRSSSPVKKLRGYRVQGMDSRCWEEGKEERLTNDKTKNTHIQLDKKSVVCHQKCTFFTRHPHHEEAESSSQYLRTSWDLPRQLQGILPEKSYHPVH